jgi:hypothetical protein
VTEWVDRRCWGSMGGDHGMGLRPVIGLGVGVGFQGWRSLRELTAWLPACDPSGIGGMGIKLVAGWERLNAILGAS